METKQSHGTNDNLYEVYERVKNALDYENVTIQERENRLKALAEELGI